MRIVAKREFHYGGKAVMPGQVVETTDSHGRALKAIGKAADAPPVMAVEVAPVKPMDTQNSAPISPVTPAVPPRRGRYFRRDVQASPDTEVMTPTGDEDEIARMLGR